MFSKPRSCCFCIDNKIATLILAVLQSFSFAAQAYLTYNSYDDSYFNYSFFFSVFFFIIGLYGIFGVFTKNLRLVYVFAVYYWAQLVITLITGISLSVAALYSHTETCDLISQDYEEFVFCNDNFFSVYSLSLVGFGLIFLLRLHFAFSIWTYFRSLQAEKKAEEIVPEAPSKVVYPQFAFVSDVKAPIEA